MKLVRRRLPVSKIVVVMSLAIPLGAVAALAGGSPARQLPLTGGGAWLASPALGLVTLIDGPAERVVGSVRAAGASDGESLSVVQSGSSAYAVNGSQGTVSFIDGATYDQTSAVRFTDAGSTPVVRIAQTPATQSASTSPAPGPGDVFVIDTTREIANVVEPRSLGVRDQLALSAAPAESQSLVDDAGRLWIVDGKRGGVTWLLGNDKRVTPGAVPATTRLVRVQGEAVAVDAGGQRAGRIGLDGKVAWSCLAASDDPATQYLGSASAGLVYAVAPSTGTLTVADLDDGECSDVLRISAPGDDFGPIAQNGRYLFVPDRTAGAAVVIDLERLAVAATVEVAKPGAALELISHNSYVFYNDLGSDLAGVLKLDGAGRWRVGEALRKYHSGDQGDLLQSTKQGRLSDAIADLESRNGAGGSGDSPPDDAADSQDSRVDPPSGTTPTRAPVTGEPATGAPPPGSDPRRPPGTVKPPGGIVTKPPRRPTTTTPPVTTPPVTTPASTINLCCVRTKQTEIYPGETVTFQATEDLAGDAATWQWSVTSSTGGPGSGPTPGEPNVSFNHTFTEVGTYTVTVTVVFGSQSASDSKTVTVLPPLDRTRPTFPPGELEDFDTFNGSMTGEVVDYVQPVAEDDTDPNPSVSCTPRSGTRFPLGDTTVECTATDASGNSRTEDFVVTVNRRPDDTPPTVTLTVSSSSVDAGGSVTFTATAEDPGSPITQISITGTVSYGCQSPESAISGISPIDPVVDNDDRVTYTWNPPANPCILAGEEGYRTGTATLTATATSEGGEGTSATVSSTIREP